MKCLTCGAELTYWFYFALCDSCLDKKLVQVRAKKNRQLLGETGSDIEAPSVEELEQILAL